VFRRLRSSGKSKSSRKHKSYETRGFLEFKIIALRAGLFPTVQDLPEAGRIMDAREGGYAAI
jgi:hypothetical protein